MKLEKIVGQNIARLRSRWQLSQPDLGKRIGELTGKDWSRPTVSAAENGNRSFTASDLVVLAYVLEVPVTALLHLPPDVDTVEAGSKTFRRDELEASGWQRNETSETLGQLSEGLTSLKVRLDHLQDDAHEIEQLSTELSTAALRLRTQQSIEAKGADDGR